MLDSSTNGSCNLSLEEDKSESDSDEPPPLFMTTSTSQTTLLQQQSAQELPSLMEQMMADATVTAKDEVKIAPRNVSTRNFGSGMKKGFLCHNSKAKKKKTHTTAPAAASSRILTAAPAAAAAAVVVTTPTVTASSPVGLLLLPEVQQQKQRMDPHPPLDLHETMTSNPRLFRALQDPTFVGALHIIQNDPTKAKAIFNENPQLASLFQEFGRVLGLHYSKLVMVQQKKQQRQDEAKLPEEQMKQVSTKNTRDPDQETVNKILANREMAELLMDPNMQRVMQECGVPGRMQAYMQHPEYGPKLRKLINAGLLKVA
jgi:hypothetical protein